jgi:predicted XRE-type DNA-binding protein
MLINIVLTAMPQLPTFTLESSNNFCPARLHRRNILRTWEVLPDRFAIIFLDKKITMTTVTRGTHNIFADLGLPNADAHMLKARLVICIDKMIEQTGLTQQTAAKRIGISQPDVSNLLRGRFEGFSLERLLSFVRLLRSRSSGAEITRMEKKDV